MSRKKHSWTSEYLLKNVLASITIFEIISNTLCAPVRLQKGYNCLHLEEC